MPFDFSKKTNPGIRDIKPYVAGKSLAELLYERGIADAVKMASNENPLGACPSALKAFIESASRIYQYPDVSCRVLRSALSALDKLGDDYFICGSGADGIIYALALAFLDQDDEVIIPTVTFPLYKTVCLCMRVRVIPSRLTDDMALDLSDILAKINAKTKMIWICNPNNPTGTQIDREEFSRFLRQVPESVLVVHDEVYVDFADRRRFPDTIELIRRGQSNLVLLRSLSKVYGLAGIRLGYGIGQPELIKLLYRVRNPFEVSLPAQEAGLAALRDQEFYEQSVNLIVTERAYLYRRLEELNLRYVTSYTNFILIELGDRAAKLCDRLLDQGVIVRYTASHGMPRHIRVSVGRRADNDRFLAALQKSLAEPS